MMLCFRFQAPAVLVAVLMCASCTSFRYSELERTENSTFDFVINAPEATITSINHPTDSRVNYASQNGVTRGSVTVAKVKHSHLKFSVGAPGFESQRIRIKRRPRTKALIRSSLLSTMMMGFPLYVDVFKSDFYQIRPAYQSVRIDLLEREQESIETRDVELATSSSNEKKDGPAEQDGFDIKSAAAQKSKEENQSGYGSSNSKTVENSQWIGSYTIKASRIQSNGANGSTNSLKNTTIQIDSKGNVVLDEACKGLANAMAPAEFHDQISQCKFVNQSSRILAGSLLEGILIFKNNRSNEVYRCNVTIAVNPGADPYTTSEFKINKTNSPSQVILEIKRLN